MNPGTGAATRIGNFRTFPVSRDVNCQASSTDANILRLVGKNKRVLELGCGCGHMSRALREQGCTVVGLEIHAEAAQAAAAICERVIVGDLDYLNFDAEIGADRFDVVVAADVLEHLKDPLSVLVSVKRFLLPNGYVVASVPNVAHISIRLALLMGKFAYGQTGLLDQTHLRFLTRESLEKLMEDADLAIGHFERIRNIPDDPSRFEVPYDPAVLPPALLEQVYQDPDALTYQFVVAAYPLPESGLSFVQHRIKQLAHDLDDMRNETARLRSDLACADAAKESVISELGIARKKIDELEDGSQSLREHASALAAERLQAETRVTAMIQDMEFLQNEIVRLQDIHRQSERVRESIEEELQVVSRKSGALVSEKAAADEHIASLIEERDSLKREVACLQEVGERSEQKVAFLREDAQLRSVEAEEQSQRISGLKAQVETLLTREKDLRDMLLEAHDQLLRRDEEIALTLAAALPQAAPTGPQSQSAPAGKYLHYRQLLQKMSDLVCAHLPNGGNVLVVSKGDDDLLRLDRCRASHFPQRDDGSYAGYYPADGVAAVAHLKEVQERGAQFLVFPQTAMWWLDHYRELADYLNQNCRRVINDPEICLMFDISPAKPAGVPAALIRITAQGRPFGVNVSGNMTSEKGVGEGVRGQVRGLMAAEVPVALNNVLDDSAVNLVNEFTDLSEDNPYAANLIHLNADALAHFVESREKSYFEGHYNIGFWAWETSVFPSGWWDRFQYLDEIWVGSDFVLDAISRVSPIPVIKTPLAIPDRSALNVYPRSHFGLNERTFVFLFAFDFMSVVQRKNPLGLIRAFRNAFGNREDVTLILKCGHSIVHPFEAKLVKEAAQGANIKLIDTVLSREEVNSLMHASDCYVSLHRSEGFGLTLAEAMSLGKPVIATAYSGNMDFMSPSTSYLVRYKLIEIDKPYGPYREGDWADPDLDHAADLMRFVYKNRAEAKDVGRRGRAHILRTLSPAATGALMRNRLLRIADLGKISAPDTMSPVEQPKSKSNGFYWRLVERIHRIVEAKIPMNAHIAVVSRGDEQLVAFSGRDGGHFPQDSDGKYAGYHPANDAEAIGHLDTARQKGAKYLLFPQTAFWWLDHYSEFQSHLETRYRRVWSDPDCVIYGLAGKTDGAVSRFRQRIARRL